MRHWPPPTTPTADAAASIGTISRDKQSCNQDAPPVLTDLEARTLCALSQRVRSHRRLARMLGTTTATLDRLVWRSRRILPRTMARVRFHLRRVAAEHRVLVLVHGVNQ